MAKKVYPVAIVGAGIHGTAITARLLESYLPRESVALIDESACCQAWEKVTSNMGMTHMRSPWAHYLAGHGQKLRIFTAITGKADALEPPTPPLALFNDYSRMEIVARRIERFRIPARVTKITVDDTGVYTLELSTTSWTGLPQKIRARNVVIATGQGKPYVPDIPGVDHPRISHSHYVNIYDEKWAQPQRILIIGGGLTAATLAVRLAENGHETDVAMRAEMKVYPFDFPPAWFEGDLYHKFRDLDSPSDRVQMLKENTYGGSITPEYAERMKSLYPAINILESVTVQEFAHMPSGGVIPVWDDHLGPYDRVILATGYDPHIRHLDFLRPLFPKIYQIDGFPILGNTLEATNGLFFSGALARLGIGAAAPNVYGADLAGRIIRDELIRKQKSPPA